MRNSGSALELLTGYALVSDAVHPRGRDRSSEDKVLPVGTTWGTLIINKAPIFCLGNVCMLVECSSASFISGGVGGVGDVGGFKCTTNSRIGELFDPTLLTQHELKK